MSAELVVKYKQALPDQIESAYEDIAGNHEFDCVLKRQYGKRDSKITLTCTRRANGKNDIIFFGFLYQLFLVGCSCPY